MVLRDSGVLGEHSFRSGIAGVGIVGSQTNGEVADARLVPLPDVQGATAPEAAEEAERSPLGRGAVGASLQPSAAESIEGLVLPYVTAPNSIEGIICDRFGDDCDYWIALAVCESSLSPQAIGYAGAYIGTFQIWLGHGYGYDWLLDPYNNTLAAWVLSRGGTVTSPWPVCRHAIDW